MAIVQPEMFGQAAAEAWFPVAIAPGGSLHTAFTAAVNQALAQALAEEGAIAKAIQASSAANSVEILRVESAAECAKEVVTTSRLA